MVMQSHAVPNADAAHERTKFHNRARRFVAEDARRWNGSEVDLLDVGGTDATGGDSNEQFVRSNARHG
jgi:hypothetical protein